jgi:hypothetical protein
MSSLREAYGLAKSEYEAIAARTTNGPTPEYFDALEALYDAERALLRQYSKPDAKP